MAKTKNNSLRLQQAVKSIFEDYRKKSGCLAPVYKDAACGCDNALQMWRGPKGDKGDQGPQGPKGDNAGSFLVDAEFVVDPEGQEPGSYLKLVLIDVAQQEQVVYVNLSELTDIYTGGNGISVIDMVVAAKLGAGLTFDSQGNITSAYQFCDGLDETSNVVRVRIDTNNNILGFASGTCGGLTATVQLEAGALGEQSGGTTVYVPHLVLYGKNNTVLGRVKLADSDTIDVQMLPNDAGFTWLVNPSGLVSSQTGNQITVSQTDSKLYVGKDTLSYTIGEGTFTLTHPDGTTSAITVPSAVRMLDRADMVCEGENAPYLRLTFKRDNGLNLYQDIDMSCLATAELSLDVGCDDTVTDTAPDTVCGITIVLYTEAQYNAVIAGTSQSSEGSFIIPDPSADFTTELAAYPGGPDPYAIGLEVYLADPDTGCSEEGVLYASYNQLVPSGFEPPAQPVPLADLLSSGTVLHTESTAYPDPLHLSVVDNQDSTYTFSLRLRHEETTLTADLVSGENRVDMTPLLTKIGGKITKKLGEELTPIPIAGQNKAGLAPADVPSFYFTEQDCCNDTNEVQIINSVADDTSVTFYFSGLTRPQYVYLGFAFVDANGAPVSNTGYETAMDWSACTDISCSVAAMISGNVVLQGIDIQTGNLVDDFIVTHCEEVIDEQENYGLKFTFFQAAMSDVLCLEPSCDPCIDLSPIISDNVIGVRGDMICEPQTYSLSGSVRNIYCYDANHNGLGYATNVSISGNKITATLRSNTASFAITYEENSGRDAWNSMLDAVSGSTACAEREDGNI